MERLTCLHIRTRTRTRIRTRTRTRARTRILLRTLGRRVQVVVNPFVTKCRDGLRGWAIEGAPLLTLRACVLASATRIDQCECAICLVCVPLA